MTKKQLTQSRLKEILYYDDDTGEFTYLVDIHRIKKGSVADCVNQAGYIRISVDGKRYRAQRLAFLYMTGRWPKDQLDHKNQIKDDNRWCNLRECTASQNKANVTVISSNTSGYKGVVWDENRNKWRAQITVNQKARNLGRFSCKHEAARAYNRNAIKLFGEFAYLNEIND